MRFFILLNVIILNILIVGCGGGGSEDQNRNQNESSSSDNIIINDNAITHLSMYMTGSDLEEKSQAASKDLHEIIDGYQRLSTKEKENIRINIAFGGSKSNYWQGVKYADIDCLIVDAEDNQFGNANCYDQEQSERSMGDTQTLQNFITYASNKINEKDKNIFILWNHGSAYKGICYDSNEYMDNLTLDELDNAFKVGEIKFDIIGMDACLMANLEVANTLKNYAKYQISSEALEPTHGWKYDEIIEFFGKQPNATDIEIGRKIIDSYLDSKEHENTHSKTLSMVDLTRVNETISVLDKVMSRIEPETDFQLLLDATSISQQFNQDKDSGIGLTMDFRGFIDNLDGYSDENILKTTQLKETMNNLIIYERHQESEEISGISIERPYEKNKLPYKGQGAYISDIWYNTIANFISIGNHDITKPNISNEHKCEAYDESGYCMNITDDVGLNYVLEVNMLPYGDKYLYLGAAKIKPFEGNQYFLRHFNGEWLWYCDDESETCIFPSAFNFEPIIDNKLLYYTYATLNDIDVIFYISLDFSLGKIDSWAIAIDQKNGIPTKTQYKLKKGDKLLFHYYIVDEHGKGDWIKGDQIIFSGNPVVSIKQFNVEKYFYLQASDFNGNKSISKIYRVE